MIQKKKKEKHAACRKNTHTHEPTHTLSFKRVGCTTFPTSLDGAAEVAEPRSPAERPCAAAAAAAGCGFFFLLHVSLWCPPGCWLRGHPFIPPHPPREEHLATMTITCHITAASHTHVQTKATTTWLWKCFYSVADASGWGAAGWAGFIQTVLSRNMKKCELYIMTASMLNIVAHGEVSQQILYWRVK